VISHYPNSTLDTSTDDGESEKAGIDLLGRTPESETIIAQGSLDAFLLTLLDDWLLAWGTDDQR
jgi:hypothetical protein